MAASQRKAREHSHLPTAGWSDWKRAMVPWIPGVSSLPVDCESRGSNQAGLIYSSIRSAFPSQARHCGIYEWRAKGTLRGQPNHVVYIGSTCRAKEGALRRRILEYCTSNSHKEDFINDALSKGYELWVRVKIVEGSNPSRKKAEAMENEFLDEYDYAWNKRNNGQVRYILP